MTNTEAIKSNPCIGIALSGGATRGMAHIGVLAAYQEHGIHIDLLAGTSIGAWVAALFAFKIPIDTMRRQAEDMSWLKIASLKISKSGILSNKVIGDLIRKYIGEANIEDAAIPLAIVATDIARGKKIVLQEGNLAEAVMASTSVPGIFAPIKINERLLVDGFLVENVPISPLREMGADIIIGVNLGALKEYREPTGLVNIIMNAFEIAVDANTIATVQDADILIRPRLSEISDSDSNQAEALFYEGYKAALESIPRVQKIIDAKRKKTAAFLWRKIKYFFAQKTSSLIKESENTGLREQ